MPSAITKGINAERLNLAGSKWIFDCIQDGAVADYILAPATHEDGEEVSSLLKQIRLMPIYNPKTSAY